ncbi:MAG: RNA methyltransferase [Clostridia bacterium]|nr:RNA methyltransferase [Clostridia bacterium]
MPDIIEIKDFGAPELDAFARLNERELLNRDKPENGMFVAESPKVIGRALDAGCEPVSLLLERKHIEGEAKGIIERCGDIPVYTADFDILTRITGFELTRGALCLMKRKPLKTVPDICEGAKRIAILERIMNPTNVGAIFRSAAALGFDAVLLTYECSDPLYRRAIRVSMGTVFQIPWAFIDKDAWQDKTFGYLKAKGFTSVAMALEDDSVSLEDERLASPDKTAVILGSEGEGLEKRTIELSDMTVKIPMMHGVDSLNVAAASAVAFWQLGKRK